MSNTGDIGLLRRGVKLPPAIGMAAFDILPQDIRAILREFPIDICAFQVAQHVQSFGAEVARRKLRRTRAAGLAEYRRIIAEACER